MILRLLTAALLVCGAATAQEPGRLVFETKVRDLGTVYQHLERPVEFPFVGAGDTAVRLSRYSREEEFHTSCGCTDAYVRADWLASEDDPKSEEELRWDLSKPIPAGSHGTVVATFRGESWSRSKKSTIMVRGSMADSPVILTIEAFVLRVFDTRPALVDFGDVLEAGLRGSDPTVDLVVTGKEAFEIVRWAELPEGVAVAETAEPVLLDDGRMERSLRFTLTGGAQAGSLTTSARAETSLGFDFELPISAQVLSAVSVLPLRNLHFGFPTEGETVTRTVTIDLQVADAVLPMPVARLSGDVAGHMSVEVVAREAGRAYDVVVRSLEGMPAGRYKGTLSIDFPEGSGFSGHQMPVSITVRKQS